MREELLILLSQEVHDKNGKPITVNESVCMAMVKQANAGNVRAFNAIRDTIGEMPVQKVDFAQVDFSALREIDYGADENGNRPQ